MAPRRQLVFALWRTLQGQSQITSVQQSCAHWQASRPPGSGTRSYGALHGAWAQPCLGWDSRMLLASLVLCQSRTSEGLTQWHHDLGPQQLPVALQMCTNTMQQLALWRHPCCSTVVLLNSARYQGSKGSRVHGAADCLLRCRCT